MKHVMEFLHLFSRSSIRRRMTASLLLLTLIPLIVLSLMNRYSIQNEMVRQSSEMYSMALEQAASFVSDKARLAKSLANMLSGDTTVQSEITFDELLSNDYEGAWMADVYTHQVYYKGYLLGAVSRVCLFKDCVGISFRDAGIYQLMNDAQRMQFEQWYDDPRDPNLFVTLDEDQCGRKPQYIYLLTKIPSVHRLDVTHGLIQFYISAAVFETILLETPASENSRLYLINGNGEAIVHSAREPMDSETLDAIHSKLNESGSAHADSLVSVSIDGTRYIAGMSAVQGTDWHVSMLVPYTDVVGITRQANHFLMVTVLILLLIILTLASFISRTFTRPILSLQEGVNAISEGDYSVVIPHCGSEEIDQVVDSFNFMTRRTEEMMADQYEMGQALKSAELQVLQEQINPHFLYNTLDLLHWQARRAGAEDIVDVVHSLSQFYKLSLGHGEETVSLEHELQHVSAYVHIQNVRFMNKIRLIIDVPDEIRSCSIAKIVLQPLVENSIQHGIREKDDESGVILITARMDNGEVILSVADDGVGMDTETLSGILTRKRKGYGVSNVSDRLALHYGQSARLQYESRPGEGTVVTMRLPYLTP